MQQKDQYGNEVSRLARPLPVEYLLVDVPASTPLVPIHTFTVRDDRAPFPIENRYLDGHVQDFNALSVYLSQWSADEFLAVSQSPQRTEHQQQQLLILFRRTVGRLRFPFPVVFVAHGRSADSADSQRTVGGRSATRSRAGGAVQNERSLVDAGDAYCGQFEYIVAAVHVVGRRNRRVSKEKRVIAWLFSELFHLLFCFLFCFVGIKHSHRGFSSAATTSTGSAMSASALSGMQSRGGSSSAAAVNWTCDHCTFINGSSLDACEMCGLPR